MKSNMLSLKQRARLIEQRKAMDKSLQQCTFILVTPSDCFVLFVLFCLFCLFWFICVYIVIEEAHPNTLTFAVVSGVDNTLSNEHKQRTDNNTLKKKCNKTEINDKHNKYTNNQRQNKQMKEKVHQKKTKHQQDIIDEEEAFWWSLS